VRLRRPAAAKTIPSALAILAGLAVQSFLFFVRFVVQDTALYL